LIPALFFHYFTVMNRGETRPRIEAAAAILIGGQSSRFGSDKAYLKLDTELLTVRLHKLLSQLFPQVFFVSGTSEKKVFAGAVVFPDRQPGIGPLGGLATALHHADHPYCFLTACDLPFISSELIRLIWQTRDNPDIVVPQWRGLPEPMVAFYHKRCLPAIDNAISKGNYMMKGFWPDLQIKRIDLQTRFSGSELSRLFHNINTPEDHREARRILSEQDDNRPVAKYPEP
jgi:molybdopterin-guanine dinucleotide biosynthesis protein A